MERRRESSVFADAGGGLVITEDEFRPRVMTT